MCQNMSGLSTAEVEFRKKAGLSNESVDSSTKTVAQIIRSNVVTYYNLIFLIITILLIVVGSFRDLTFLPIIIANMLIGIIQELRSKKILDDLTILNTPKITVRRNGSNQEVLADELVQDDVITLSAGGQIPADALVLSGNITVNEALITGEADEIIKKEGDPLFSGSFVISGECLAKLEKVGKDSYISGLMLQATQTKEGEQSEMIRALNRLVQTVGVIILPIGAILFLQQYFFSGATMKDSVTGMVAAILGMIPEGLYLLASVAMVVSVMRLGKQKVLIHDMKCLNTMTGGRIKRIQKYVGDEPFFMTYGDGVCDVEIDKLLEYHKSHGKIATLTAVLQDQSKGVLDIGGDNAVKSFREKRISDGAPINAGYMVLNPEIFNYIEGDKTVFEKEPLESLANMGELMSYKHTGYWQCMDNMREKEQLEKLISKGKAPWIRWED